MATYKAVLFDLDGTLRDTVDIVREAAASTVNQYGNHKPSSVELAPHMHHHSAIHRAFSDHVPYDEWLGTYRDVLGDAWKDAPLYADAEEVLKNLQAAGYRLGVVTSAAYGRTIEYLAYRNLGGYFSSVSAVREGLRPKPEADLIHDALAQLGIKSDEAIMIGDMMTDVQAAHAAGMRCIGVSHGFASRAELVEAGADDTIDSLIELLPAIARAESR